MDATKAVVIDTAPVVQWQPSLYSHKQCLYAPTDRPVLGWSLEQTPSKDTSLTRSELNDLWWSIHAMQSVQDQTLPVAIAPSPQPLHFIPPTMFLLRPNTMARKGLRVKRVPLKQLERRRMATRRSLRSGFSMTLGTMGVSRIPRWWLLSGGVDPDTVQRVAMAARLLMVEEETFNRAGTCVDDLNDDGGRSPCQVLVQWWIAHMQGASPRDIQRITEAYHCETSLHPAFDKACQHVYDAAERVIRRARNVFQ